MIPIWQTTKYSFGSPELSYYIESGNEKLFSGRAVAFPGTSTGSININKICENYLTQDLTILTSTTATGSETHNNAYKTFNLKLASDNSLLTAYTFYYNWGYEATTSTLSRPVNGKYMVGMFKLQTTADTSVVTSYSTTASAGLGYTTSACGEYAVYYLNRFGGWDSLLIEGNVREKDDFAIDRFETTYEQGVYYSRESHRFRNEITHYWELNTGWLSDGESEILAKHLLSSNNVYLHDINNSKIYPVEIVDNTVDYKKFKNDRRLISYTINIRESNKKVIL